MTDENVYLTLVKGRARNLRKSLVGEKILVLVALSSRQIPTQRLLYSANKLILIQAWVWTHIVWSLSNPRKSYRSGKCNRGLPLGDSEERSGKEWDGQGPAAGRESILSEKITEGSRALSPRLPGRPRFDPNSLWMVITWEKVPIISLKLSEVQCPRRSPTASD